MKTYVVSPGFLRLTNGQTGRITSATTDGAMPEDLELMIAGAGVVAGDATELNSEMELTPALGLELAGPGDWPIVYRFTTDGVELNGSVTGIAFEIDGIRYSTIESFDLMVSSSF